MLLARLSKYLRKKGACKNKYTMFVIANYFIRFSSLSFCQGGLKQECLCIPMCQKSIRKNKGMYYKPFLRKYIKKCMDLTNWTYHKYNHHISQVL